MNKNTKTFDGLRKPRIVFHVNLPPKKRRLRKRLQLACVALGSALIYFSVRFACDHHLSYEAVGGCLFGVMLGTVSLFYDHSTQDLRPHATAPTTRANMLYLAFRLPMGFCFGVLAAYAAKQYGEMHGVFDQNLVGIVGFGAAYTTNLGSKLMR
jgi:hypothetical protein